MMANALDLLTAALLLAGPVAICRHITESCVDALLPQLSAFVTLNCHMRLLATPLVRI